MQINHIHVENYKTYLMLDLDVSVKDEERPIILIGGMNGSGKTTVLSEMTPYPHESNGPRVKSRVIPGTVGIKELDISTILKFKFNIPVKVKNDAKCAALAEKRYGSLKDYEDAVFLCLGTGIGSAVFLNNQ